MRRSAVPFTAVIALLCAAPGAAQSSFMADVIGNTIANMNARAPTACFDGRWSPSADDAAKGRVRVESGLKHYRELAASGTDVSKAFIGSKSFRRMQIDGQPQDPRAVREPWIGQAAQMDLIAFTVGNWKSTYHAQWKAVAADGHTLGIYDAWMNKSDLGSRLIWLDLHSPATMDKVMANTPFCDQPGDIELWQKAKAEREARKAAKRAEKEAAAAAH